MSIGSAVVLIIFLCGYMVIHYFGGREDEKNKWQKEAIKRGFGEFVIIDKTTGESEFRWKEGGR